MHGGMGMTDEFEIGFFMKRARVLQELFGDATSTPTGWRGAEVIDASSLPASGGGSSIGSG